MGNCPYFATNYSYRVTAVRMRRGYARCNQLTFSRHWQPKGGSDHGVVVLMTQNQYALRLQGCSGSPITPGPLHEVVLLCDCRQLSAADATSVNSTE